MKLIITIPKEKYIYIQELERGNTDYAITRMLYHAVKRGTPLDDVKAEIETDLSWDMFDEYGNETRLHKELMQILDNIGKAESEG